MLRIAVIVEHVWDPASIEVGLSGDVDWSRAVAVPGPGSLEAVELALRLGEASTFGLGVADVSELLRRCLAMGAAAVAVASGVKALSESLRKGGFDLVLTGSRSGDGGPSPTGPLLAGLLDLPQATAVESLRVEGRDTVVMRRLDHGVREEVAVPMPAVIALEPGLIRPRQASPGALVAALGAEVPALQEISSAPTAVLLGHAAPRPAPPRLAAPDPAQPAEARIATVVGSIAGDQRRLVSGDPEVVAGRILDLLRERGFVT